MLHEMKVLLNSDKAFNPKLAAVICKDLCELFDAGFLLFDHKVQTSMIQAAKRLLQGASYLDNLSPHDILNLGRYHQLQRMAAIALIRQHQIQKTQQDYFARHHFSYALLNQAGAEQNYLYVAQYIKGCKSIPLKQLVALPQDSKSARRLLLDFTNTPYYFAVSMGLLTRFPVLSQLICREWQYLLETIPQSKRTTSQLEAALPDIIKRHPEFKAVKLKQRAMRAHKITVLTPKPVDAPTGVNKLAIGLSCLLGPSAYSHAQAIWGFSTALATGSAIVPAFTTLSLSTLPLLAPIAVYQSIRYVQNRCNSP